MNHILWLFDTCGWIFGPAIMLAGLAALGLCAWATFGSLSRCVRRRAVVLAVSPLVLGVCGFFFGLGVCWYVGVPAVPWGALGKVCLAGAVVSAVPLAWALFLPRTGGESGPRVATQA